MTDAATELAVRLAELAAVDPDVVQQRGGEALVSAYLADAADALDEARRVVAALALESAEVSTARRPDHWAAVAERAAAISDVALAARVLTVHIEKIRRRVV